MPEQQQQRVTLLVAEERDTPANVETLSAAVRDVLPWQEVSPDRASNVCHGAQSGQFEDGTPSADTVGQATGRPHHYTPTFSIHHRPVLFPAGDVIVVILVASPEEAQGAIDSLQASGLQVSRGDEIFGLHQQ